MIPVSSAASAPEGGAARSAAGAPPAPRRNALPDIRDVYRERDDAWRQFAACKGLTDLYFPERGERTLECKEVCVGCDVRAECLEYALATRQQTGVWGGYTERELRRIRRQRRPLWSVS